MTMPAREDGAIHRGLSRRRRELLVVYVMMITARDPTYGSVSLLTIIIGAHYLRDAGERVGSSDRALHPRVDGAPERTATKWFYEGAPRGPAFRGRRG